MIFLILAVVIVGIGFLVLWSDYRYRTVVFEDCTAYVTVFSLCDLGWLVQRLTRSFDVEATWNSDKEVVITGRELRTAVVFLKRKAFSAEEARLLLSNFANKRIVSFERGKAVLEMDVWGTNSDNVSVMAQFLQDVTYLHRIEVQYDRNRVCCFGKLKSLRKLYCFLEKIS